MDQHFTVFLVTLLNTLCSQGVFPEMQEPTGLHPHSMIHPGVGLCLP